MGDERCGQPKDLESASEDALKQICKEYFDRMYQCESQKYDMEFEVRKRGFEINELNIAVNDLRGKFIKPTLKKSFKIREQVCKTSEEGGRIQLPEPAQNCQEERVFHGRGRRRSGWRSWWRRVCRGCSLDVIATDCSELYCPVLYCAVQYCAVVYWGTMYCTVLHIIVQHCKVLHSNSCLHY